MFETPEDLAGPSLPMWFLLPATGLFAVATIYWIMRTPGRAARYLIFVCWVRYTLGALHEFTYREAFFGLRWVALGSAALIALGLVVLDKRRLFSKPFVPVVAICGLMVVSAIINQDLGRTIDPILRFLFFILTTVAVWQALESNGSSVIRRLLFVFAQPIVFQLASIALGVAKAGELDGSVSFIGGYYHEELFSLILAAAFLTAILATKLDAWVRAAVFALSLVGIYLTDYRTTILAVVPLAMTFVLVVVPRLVRTDQRTLARLAAVLVGTGIIIAAIAATGGRYSELAAIGSTDLFKPPEAFTYADQRILSARPYIWSQYLYAYAESPVVQQIIGHGPDSWVGKFPLYAHNTVVSFLYELGVVGVAALFWLWLSMVQLARQTGSMERALLIAAHVSFILLNMATMPHWQIEGNIFYGLLCGYTIAKHRFFATGARADYDFLDDSAVPPGASEPELIWPVPVR